MPRSRAASRRSFGPESSGKTTLALHVIANAQKGGGVAAFIDAEHALDPSWARKLGVDIDSLLFGDPILIDDGGTAVSPIRSAFEDNTGDGLLDLALNFSIPDIVEAGALGPLSAEGVLTGSTLDGLDFLGSDTFRIVPGKGAAASVPEPSSWSLLCLTLTGACWRRRRHRQDT